MTCFEITGKANSNIFNYRKFTYEEENLFLLLFFSCLSQFLSSSCRKFSSVVGQVNLPASKQVREKKSLEDFLPSSTAIHFSRGKKKKVKAS